MDSIQDIILLFTKFPLAGKSKTRLIPALGQKGAADLQKKMTQSAVMMLQHYISDHPCHLEIHHEGGSTQDMQEWLGTSHHYRAQHPGNLGHRMAAAITTHLTGSHSILLIGSDCPDIDGNILTQGFSALQGNDVVLGPAFDGGYYLIGVKGTQSRSALSFLFSDIPWGGAQVLHQTLRRVKNLQLSCHLLKKLHDIDTPEDLKYLHNYPHTQ